MPCLEKYAGESDARAISENVLGKCLGTTSQAERLGLRVDAPMAPGGSAGSSSPRSRVAAPRIGPAGAITR
jgi:hypothetical protein